MKMNPEQCHVIILGDTNILEDFTIQIDNVYRAPEVILLDTAAKHMSMRIGVNYCWREI